MKELIFQHLMCILAIATTILLHVEHIIPTLWLTIIAICLLVIINGVRTLFALAEMNVKKGL